MLALLALVFGVCWAAPVPPASTNDSIRLGGTARLFFEKDANAFLAEINAAGPSDGRKPWDYTFGWYHAFSENLKVGGFLRKAYALRHDDDWHSVAGVWSWTKTDYRGENIFIGDVTYKFKASPQLVAEFKSRYLYNSYNKDSTFLFRPGLSYFVIREGRLLGNIFAQVELDFPMNYSTRTINETWLYLGALAHQDNLDFGPFVSLGWQTWTRPEAYADKGGGDFAATSHSTTFGVLLIVSL